jgi:hypothetical protein
VIYFGFTNAVLHLEGLLGVDLDGVVFGWTIEPLVGNDNLEDISALVRSQENWVRELIGVVLVGGVSGSAIFPHLIVQQWARERSCATVGESHCSCCAFSWNNIVKVRFNCEVKSSVIGWYCDVVALG